MAIVHKTSSTTKVVTADLNIFKTGEIGYTYAAGDSEGGDRLFIGAGGNKSNGKAREIHVVGGKYFTDMLNHPRGQLHENSAIITDENKSINQLIVDNMELDGNTISTSSGDITLNPNSGIISAGTSTITNVVDPSSAQDAATKNYVDTLDIAFITADVNVDGTGNVQTGKTIQLKGAWNTNTKRTDISDNSVKVEVNVDSDLLGLSSLSVDNITIDGNTISSTSGNITIDPTPDGPAGTLIVNGNLQVEGTTTTINSTELTVDDKNIVLASGSANAAAADSAGITVDGANAQIYYKSTPDTWNFNKKVVAPNIDVEGNITVGGTLTVTGGYAGFDSDFAQKTTTDLTEGDNLYYTTARADSDAKRSVSVVDAGGDGSLSYNETSGEFTYTGPSATEVRAHFSASGDLSYDSATGQFSFDVEQVYTKENFDSDLGLASTTLLPEGDNLYYTTARFDSDFTTMTTSDLTEGSNLYFTNERVDDRIYGLLRPGEGIDFNYNDAGNEFDISCEFASINNPGIAKFDSQDFLVTAGNVELATIDCGTF